MKGIYIALPLFMALFVAVPSAFAVTIEDVCPDGTQKFISVESLFDYVCVESPTGYTFPIDTLGESVAYAQERAGLKCDGAKHISAHPVFDYPLSSLKSSSLECFDENNVFVWSIYFRNSDGQLWRFTCDQNTYPDCAEDYEYPFPAPVIESTPEYFCNKQEYYDYLRAMVNFAVNPDGSIVYPDDYDLDSTLSIEEIKIRAERACQYITGEATLPYLTETNFGWSEVCIHDVGDGHTGSCERGSYKCECTVYASCAVPRIEGSSTGVWGFRINNDGFIIPWTPRSTLPSGSERYRIGYGFVETGLCFRGCFLGTCDAPTPKPPNPNPVIHFSWIFDAFYDFVANLQNAMCTRFGLWC